MSIWKTKRGWTVKFKYEKRQYKKEGLASRAEAILWEAEKRKEVLAKAKPRKTPLTFSNIANRYLEHCQARMQKNTWRQKAFVYRSFIRYVGDPPAMEVTKQGVSDYLEVRRKQSGNKAANRDLRDLKALYN